MFNRFRFAFLFVAVGFGHALAEPKVDVLFSPGGGCSERIIAEVGKAKETVQVQAYSFTSAPIAKAILEAKKRGVSCSVILDASQETQNYSELDFFHNQGIPTWIDARHAIAHNKIIIIDGKTVITGSFNFTAAAEDRNSENLLVINGDDALAKKYVENFTEHLGHSRKYAGKPENKTPRAPPETAQAPAAAIPVPIPVASSGAVDAKSEPTADQTVYVTKTGKKYHSAGCSYLSKSQIPMKLSEAKRGYGPCSRCRPPE